MPQVASPAFTQLTDLTRAIQEIEGFAEVLDALRQRRSAAVDGAWGSSAALAAAAPGAADAAHPARRHRPSARRGWLARRLAQLLRTAADASFPPGTTSPAAATASTRSPASACASCANSTPTNRRACSSPRFKRSFSRFPIGPRFWRKLAAGCAVGETYDPEELATWLVEHGYRHTDAVELPGEFCRRGGILDVFSPDAETPYRVEFFGDEIDSIRQFAPETQRSLGNVSRRADRPRRSPVRGKPSA